MPSVDLLTTGTGLDNGVPRSCGCMKWLCLASTWAPVADPATMEPNILEYSLYLGIDGRKQRLEPAVKRYQKNEPRLACRLSR